MTFIDAGAGTGKTTRLVREALHRVLGGEALIDELAVITFTEKAAAELRDKVRLALTAVAAGEPPDRVRDDPLPDGPDATARATTALAHLHEATICTLHAFAQRLLDRHGEGGEPTSILDGVDQEERFSERWHHVAGELLADPALSAALDRSVALGVELGHWREVARELDEQWDRCGDWLARPSPSPALGPVRLDGVIAELEAVLAAAGEVARRDDDKLAAFILDNVPDVIERLRDAAGTGDDFVAAHALTGSLRSAGNAGRQAAWGSDARLRAAKAQVDAPRRLLGEVALASLLPILRHLGAAAVLDGEARVAARTMTYHDLLVAALSLVRSDPLARVAARLRYRALLIDEFQDTDPLQADLALALCWEGDAGADGARAGDQAGVDNGEPPAPLPAGEFSIEADRLHFVGDPKQSIYRFRRADVHAYERMKARFEGQVEWLQHNRRSRPVIVDWVNRVFAPLMLSDGQVDYVELLAARDEVVVGGPGVAVIGGPTTGSAEDLKAGEADAVARSVAVALASWQVADPDDGSIRGVRPSDVAVLLRTRALLPELGDALTAAGIPYRVESRGYAWSSQEIHDVLTVLDAVADPANPPAVVAALRSRTLGCSDDELMQWRSAGGRFELEGPRPDNGNPAVASGLDWLAGLSERRYRLDVAALVRAVIAERHLMAAALDRPRPRDAWARLQLLTDAADTFVDTDPTATLRRFLQRCAWAKEQGAVSTERLVAEPDDDAVRILTIHAAKGLEFPVVFVAGLGLSTSHGTLRVRWDTNDAGESDPIIKLEVRTGDDTIDVDFRPRTFKDVAADDRYSDALEAERLAYVATTRARDHLVLSVFHKPVKKRAPGDRRLAEDLANAVAGARTPLLVEPAPSLRERAETGAGDVAAWEALHAEWAELCGPPVAATELRTRRASEHERSSVAAPATGATASYDATAPRRFGSAVHAVAETMPFGDDSAAIDWLVREGAAAHAVADVDGVRRCVEALRATTTWRSATAATRSWRELNLDGTIDGVVVSAQADLVWEQPDGTMAVADWKNDPSTPDELRARYADQLRTYAALIAAASGRAVTAATIVAVHPVTGVTTLVEVLQ